MFEESNVTKGLRKIKEKPTAVLLPHLLHHQSLQAATLY